MAIIDVDLREAQGELYVAIAASVSLHSDDPGVDGNDNEFSGGGYSRASLSWNYDGSAQWHTDSMEIDVPVGELTHIVIRDSSEEAIDIQEFGEVFPYMTTYTLVLNYEQT